MVKSLSLIRFFFLIWWRKNDWKHEETDSSLSFCNATRYLLAFPWPNLLSSAYHWFLLDVSLPHPFFSSSSSSTRCLHLDSTVATVWERRRARAPSCPKSWTSSAGGRWSAWAAAVDPMSCWPLKVGAQTPFYPSLRALSEMNLGWD